MAVIARNRSSKAYVYIRNQLMTGQLRAGARVSDAEVASEMGISRTPVREALIRLENEGLVEQVPRVGIFVRVPTARELLELYEMRRLLESYAAAKAARRINAEQLSRLREYCEVLRSAAKEARQSGAEVSEQWTLKAVTADIGFHLTIMKAAGNRRLMNIVSSMRLMSRIAGHNWSNPQKQTLQHNHAHTLLDHVRIYRALSNADARAARYWMRQHLRPPRKVAADLYLLQRNLSDAEAAFTDWPESIRQSLRDMERDINP